MNHGCRFIIKPATKIILVVVATIMIFMNTVLAQSQVVHPFENPGIYKPNNDIDTFVAAALHKRGIEPANLCSDEVFIRRVFLDLNGTLPEPKQVRTFLNDKKPEKRAVLIDMLLKRKEFADYWSLKWCDILRVKAEFPINLWPNAVQAYHRWIHDAIKENMPYNQFARELLTSSGSNFRVPQVNFYRAIQGKQAGAITRAVALTFMGVRIEKWPQQRIAGMESLFSQVAYKNTGEWKEEIVYPNPEPAETFEAVLPDGVTVRVETGRDPRQVFADWLITPENPWFAKNIVNRIWAWLLGRGIIHKPDDIRPDNSPVYPQVLDYLEKELVAADFNLRHIYRLILNSRTYQQSSIPQSTHTDAETLFACYPLRQLDAEVLIDALSWFSGIRESYSSPIPEPFTFIPEENRSIELADGSITSQFLEMFGRPARDTGLESERTSQPTDAQRLHFLNSTHIKNTIERSWRMRRLVRTSKNNNRLLAKNIYLHLLSRYPTQDELSAVEEYFQAGRINRRQAANDLVWALINTKEFLCRH